MLSHEQIWAVIDAHAARFGMSASGLAKRAGLDSTAFNKSKRHSADGRPRWPSMESIAKVIEATGVTIEELFEPIRAGEAAAWRAATVPLMGFARAGAGGFFDDAGFPVGEGWERVELPGGAREGSYALRVQGDSMEPLYRDGDVLIVEPGAAVRRGDRVVARTVSGEVMAKILERRTATVVELASLNPAHPQLSFAPEELEWIARIAWASQ